MKVRFTADGTPGKGTPLVMHNERLMDPLDSFTQAVAELSGKRRKSLEDHAEMGRREFMGSAYTNPPVDWPLNGQKYDIAIPTWNALRCIEDGAKRHRRGPDVKRGIHALNQYCDPLEFDGPRDLELMWKDTSFALRKGVGIGQRRIMRTRIYFLKGWRLIVTFEVDPTIWDVHTLKFVWADAGKYCGLGDIRPVYGNFTGTLEVTEADDDVPQKEASKSGRRTRTAK